MDKKFGIYIFAGLLIGGIFGVFLGTAVGSPAVIAVGALGGLFVGWFAAAAASSQTENKR